MFWWTVFTIGLCFALYGQFLLYQSFWKNVSKRDLVYGNIFGYIGLALAVFATICGNFP
jgi:uncharacterized membrane protein YidH (DUF202 family)